MRTKFQLSLRLEAIDMKEIKTIREGITSIAECFPQSQIKIKSE